MTKRTDPTLNEQWVPLFPIFARRGHNPRDYRVGYINRNGYPVIAPTRFDEGRPFSEGLAAVREDGKWGYIDVYGTYVIAPELEAGSYFCDGLATFRRGKYHGFIDASGAVAIAPRFDAVGSFSEGFAWTEVDGRYGFLRKTGKELVPLIYDSVRDFSEGLASVKQGLKWATFQQPGR